MAAEDQRGCGVDSGGSPRPSRRLSRLLHTHATKVEAVRNAELAYHGVVLTESLRHGGKVRRASSRRITEAFAALTDAVVDLQGSHAAVLSLAEDEGIPSEAVGSLDEGFESANREYAGYLAARTYDQVHEVARRGPLRDRSS
ncbi:MAG: hypothetical protein ABR941_09185 [Thermoleophilia bacterium]